jgi:hypothetical protein
MSFVVGKSVIYDIDQAIPAKSELYTFDNISVSNIINVRHDSIDGDVVDYQIKFGLNTTQFRITQTNTDYAKINSFDIKIYVNNVRVARESINASQVIDQNGLLQEMMVYFTVRKKELDAGSGNVMLIVSAVSSKGANIPGLSIQKKLDYIGDKNRYFIPNDVVKISAAPSSFNSFLITVIKPPRTNIQGVKITRKLAGSNDPRKIVREINFNDQLGSKIGEDIVYQFIDTGDTFEDLKNQEPGSLDAFLAYEYRAVPFGFEGAPGNRFFDTTTDPIQHTSVLIGQDLEVLAFPKNSKKFGFSDQNLIGVGKPAEIKDKVGIVSQVSNFGIFIQVHDIPEDHYINIVRRNITTGETEFSRLDDPRANGIFGGKEKSLISYLDETALAETTYEYACEIVSLSGASNLSFDTTTTTHLELKNLAVPGLITSANLISSSTTSVNIVIETQIPEGQIDAVVRDLQDRGIKNNFDNDVDKNRSSLQNSISYKVVRLNLTTGEENIFLSSDSNFSGFENLSLGEKVSTLKLTSFIDTSIEEKNSYRYIVITLMRDIEQLLETTIPVVDNNNSYISFPAKTLHPLSLRRGTLPPTKANKFFELGLVKNENTNPKRLLDFFTALSEFELGEVSARAFIPTETDVITIDQSDKQLFVDPKLLKTSAPSTVFNWALKGTKNVSSFNLEIVDEFYNLNGRKIAERVSKQQPYPNDSRLNFQSEDIIETFTTKDIEDSRIVTFNSTVLDAINDSVKVLRFYRITPVLFDKTELQDQVSQSIDVSREVLI